MENKKIKSKGLRRRSFIKKSVAASTIFIVPRNVLGCVGFTAPSDQLAIAAIGAGDKEQETSPMQPLVEGKSCSTL